MNQYEIDDRSRTQLEEEMETLAASYVPEWRFDRENPDIGSALVKVFAGQMYGNIVRCNQVLEKYHTEFVNLLGISLLPARPAQAVVIMEPVQNTIPGVEVLKGTRLLADVDDYDGQIIFETLHDLYVTAATLRAVFMTEKKTGAIVPLLGHFEPPAIVEELSGTGENINPAESGLKPFYLFSSKEKGIGQHALLIYHSRALDVEDDNIYIRFTGGGELMEALRRGDFCFQYYSEEGLITVEEVKPADDSTLILRKQKKNKRVEIDSGTYGLLVLKALKPVQNTFTLEDLRISSSGKAVSAEFVGNGNEDLDPESFLPFGDTLSLYQECYIGHDAYFSKAGALVSVEFDLSIQEHRILGPQRQEDTELKLIKKKPKVYWTDAAADVRADEVSLEYFNGLGWKKLNCLTENRNMFAADTNVKYKIAFCCPADWEQAGAGAFQARCIRIRLLKTDNCYMVPSVHHYPVIRNLKISFSYEDSYMKPEHLVSICGTRKTDLTREILASERFTAFSGGEYADDGLYLGFDKKLEKGPVSLLFQLDDSARFQGVNCSFYYSSPRGFQQMKILDHTLGMSRPGTVRFLPPSDMCRVSMEGHSLYWIKVSPSAPAPSFVPTEPPFIRNICFNAVEAANVETRNEENFYLEEARPNMEIALGVSDILDMELWVNEKNTISRPMMRRMLEETPEDVRAEYDLMGEITSFYVRWVETDRLDFAPQRRSYLLDRLNSVLTFGDGIQTDFPRVTDTVAFKAVLRRCCGQEGNVEPGRINSAMGSLMFISEIYNPVKAYGGSSMESLEGALRRGANMIKSRRRLVSMDDYIQEIMGYSDLIAQVKGVTGRTADGERCDGALTFLILLKDFEVGSYSFHSLSGSLKKHLQEACELTVGPDDLYLMEPVYASVSVELWVRVRQMDDSFEAQNLLRETLERYLNPVTGESGRGWPIGTLPKRTQLLIRLNMLRSTAVVRRMSVTVAWRDAVGEHEADLDSAPANPFFVCRSGEHRVHVSLSDE
ncbi:MAG: hypothetical protein LUH19_01310 [Lachnospiraceae bacterium]|nr:hypothetical protein [Lachnospiraceae bacterium]